MVPFYLMTLECSIFSQQIIQSFEIVTCLMLNLLKKLLLLKWLIYGNDYLRPYNYIDKMDWKKILGDM